MSALSADTTYSHTLTELTDEIAEYEYELDEKTGNEHVRVYFSERQPETTRAAFSHKLTAYSLCTCTCIYM